MKILQKTIFLILISAILTVAASAQQTAEDFYKQGVEQAKSGKYDLAIASFDDAVKLKSNYLEAYLERSRAKQNNQRDLDGAFADIEKVIELNPSLGEAYFERSVIRGSQFLKLLKKVKEMPSAEALKYQKPVLDDLNLAIDYGYRTEQVFLRRADYKCRVMQNCKESIVDFDQAILLNPKNYGSYINRSVAKFKSNDTTGAIADLREAVNRYGLDENDRRFSGLTAPTDQKEPVNRAELDRYTISIACVNLGTFLLDSGETEIALIVYNQAIEIEPNNFSAYGARGRYAMIFGDLEEALKDFDKAIELRGKKPSPIDLINRGIAFKLMGKEMEAQKDFEKAIEIDPTSKNRINYFLELTKRQREQKKIRVELPR